MFTGIITSLGTVSESSPNRLVISCTLDETIGASVAVDGCCLTVAESEPGFLAFDVMEETLAKTIVGTYAKGTQVNLEPALSVGDRMGGHWVQGHIDGVGTIQSITVTKSGHDILISVPTSILETCVERGSIAINGVSLTVMSVGTGTVGVSLIPETLRATNLAQLSENSPVNVEGDILAKYVQNAIKNQLQGAST